MFKREKRFLLLMREYVLGGAETQFRYLIEYAEKQKWKLDVLVEHDLNRDDVTLKKTADGMNSVRFYELNGDRESGKLYWSVICHILGKTIHTKYEACLIYYPLDLTIAPFMYILGIRVIYSERVDAAGVAASQHLQHCLKFCRYVSANSKYAQKELEKQTGRNVKFIRNGKPVITPFPAKKERKIRRILIPARIAPAKNQMLFLYFLKNNPDFEGELIFAGLEEDRTYRNKMKQFVCRNNLANKVVFLGYVENMAEEYEKADLVALPSLAEGTPNVVLEAYAYGRPVIVSDIGVERDIVKNPKLRFGVKNPEEIAMCIKYIEKMSDDSYEKMIDKNRKFVLQNYSIEKMAESFYKIMKNGGQDIGEINVFMILHRK